MKQSDFSPNNPVHPFYKKVNSMDPAEYESFVKNKIHWEIEHCKQQVEEIQRRKKEHSDKLGEVRLQISNEQKNYNNSMNYIANLAELLNVSSDVDADVGNTSFAQKYRSRMNELSLQENSSKKRVEECNNELKNIENKISFWEQEIEHFHTPIVKMSYFDTLVMFLQGAACIFFISFLTACTLAACKLDDCTLYWIADYLCYGCEEIGCGIIPLGETPIIPLNTIIFYLIITIVISKIYYKNRYENVEDRIE